MTDLSLCCFFQHTCRPTTAAASTLRCAYAILSFSLNKPDEYVWMRAACPLKEAGHIRKKVCDGSVFAEILTFFKRVSNFD
jgi:hypothetical protein